MAANRARVETLEDRKLLSAAEPVWEFGYKGLVQDNRNVADGAVAATADGKVLLVRITGSPDAPPNGPTWLTRYLASGLPDPDFGGTSHGQPMGTPDGTVQVGPDVFLKDIAGIKVQPDGHILIAGTFVAEQDATGDDIVVVKLNIDGSLDTSFGGAAHGYTSAAGIAQLDLFSHSEDTVTDLALASDGRIAVVGGSFNDAMGGAVAVVLQADGSRDTSFSGDGVTFWRTGSQNDTTVTSYVANAVDFDADGNLLIGGAKNVSDLTQGGSVVVSSWQLSAFTGDGTVLWDAPLKPNNFRGAVTDVAFSHDGAVYAAGGNYDDFGVARVMLTNGNLDPNFGTYGGFFRVPFAGGAGVYPRHVTEVRVASLSDGRFYLLTNGYTDVESDFQYTLSIARYMPNGTLDPIYVGPWIVEVRDEILWTDFALNGDNPLVANTAFADFGGQIIQPARIHQFQGGESAKVTHSGYLQVGGTSGVDHISIELRTSDQRIVVNVNDKVIRSFARSSIKRALAYSFGGDDIVVGAGSPKPILMNGGPGADTLTGSEFGDAISGGTGNDVIIGRDGNDVLSGNGGNDYLFGGNGNDSLFGSGGRDTLRGEEGDDQLFGGPGSADLIYGGLGNDSAARDALDKYKDVEVLL